jgi:hypothetical protein
MNLLKSDFKRSSGEDVKLLQRTNEKLQVWGTKGVELSMYVGGKSIVDTLPKDSIEDHKFFFAVIWLGLPRSRAKRKLIGWWAQTVIVITRTWSSLDRDRPLPITRSCLWSPLEPLFYSGRTDSRNHSKTLFNAVKHNFIESKHKNIFKRQPLLTKLNVQFHPLRHINSRRPCPPIRLRRSGNMRPEIE